jgi:hypothetical protein
MIEQILVSLIILWSAWKIVEAVDYNDKVINKEKV